MNEREKCPTCGSGFRLIRNYPYGEGAKNCKDPWHDAPQPAAPIEIPSGAVSIALDATRDAAGSDNLSPAAQDMPLCSACGGKMAIFTLKCLDCGCTTGCSEGPGDEQALAKMIIAEMDQLDADKCQYPESHYNCYMIAMQRLVEAARAALGTPGAGKND